MEKKKKENIDNYLAAIPILVALALFIANEFTTISWLTPNKKMLLAFTTILFIFYEFLSFVWKTKFNNIKEAIVGQKQNEEEETTIKSVKNEMCTKFQSLAEHNTAALKQRNL